MGVPRPENLERRRKGEDARSLRQAAAGGGAAGGERRRLRAAAPCGEGQLTAAHRGCPRLQVSAQDRAQNSGSRRPRSLGGPAPPSPGRGVSCLRRASVGAGAAACSRDALGPAGALGAEELGARRRATSTSCRAGPRRPAAAAGAKRRPGRRPGQRRARSGSGSSRCQLPVRPQGRQRQRHYRRRQG